MPYESELDAAREAADLAGLKLQELYTRFVAIPDAPASISTEADRQAQEIILQHLHRKFPTDALCAEESTPMIAVVPNTGPRLWIVDPIDGTRGFARKNGEFSVMIGFVDQGQAVVGVVLEPARTRVTYAARGGGCWRRDGAGGAISCRVSAQRDMQATILTQSRSRDPGRQSRWVKQLAPARVIETYSAGIKLAQVARGEADIYLNSYDRFHDWDICAGHVLVEEAGGRVTGLAAEELHYGLPGAWQRHGLLATNGLLHEAALTAIRDS